jgi:penicillin-binding protein 1C
VKQWLGARNRRRVLALVAAVVVACAWLAWGAWWRALREQVGQPEPGLDDRWHDGQRVLDRNGALLRELPTDYGRRGRPLALDEIGVRLVAATLVSEDADFYAHDGIDRGAMLRALQQNLRHGRFVSGASTITQQLVKLLDTRGVTSQRDLSIKLREAARAQNLELELGKDRILVEYCNRLPYGHGLVGPELAALAYFGVHSRELSWAQAALLAVLPRAPSALDPYAHLDRALLRQRALLHALHERGQLDEDALARALAEPIELRTIEHPWLAPHFVAMLQAEQRLAPHGATTTTLDVRLQHDVEGLVRTHVTATAEHQARNAAVIVVDNASGEVLAWVGSADHDDVGIDGQVDMVRARRQPGSTLKPFVVAEALAAGHTGAELVADVPTEFVEHGAGVYAPGNFDGRNVGPIALREALAASLNVPMVRLAAELGPARLLASLRALGFTSLDRSADHYGIAIALGTGEVELRELAAAYVALARGGEAIALRVVASETAPVGTRVIDPAIAAAVTEMLSDPLARVRLLAGRSPFDIGFALAVKTGTSSGYRDAWTVGYTAERTVAVWVGNADGSATRGVTGAGGAGPLFADVMRRAMLDVPTRAELFDRGLLEPVEVCALSGMRPGAQCPDRITRRFVPDHLPAEGCALHRAVREQPPAGAGRRHFRCDPDGDTTIVRLPAEFSQWLAQLPDGAPGKDARALPWIAHDRVEGCEEVSLAPPSLRIDAPVEGSVYARASDGPRDVIELRAHPIGTLEVDAIEFVIDGRVVARSSEAPFVARVAVGPGDHELRARPVDRAMAVLSETAHFSVR